MPQTTPVLFSCLSLLTLLALNAAPAAERDPNDDIIVLNNQHRLLGKVLSESTDTVVRIETGNGIIALERSLVDRVEPGYNSRLKLLAPGDYQGHLELAKWARLNDRPKEALDLLKRFATSASMTAEGMGLLARLTDEIEGPDPAFDHYRKYKELGGQDPVHLQRLQVLEEEQARYDRALAEAQNKLLSHTVEEGLEVKQGWRPELPEFANPMKAEVKVIPGGVKNQGLKLSFRGGKKYKAVVRRSHNIDVRASPVMVMDAINLTGKTLHLSIAVKTGDTWDYFESTAKPIPNDKKWHRLTFNLMDKSFKCKKDNYGKHAFAVDNPDNIRETQFQVHNTKNDGVIWIDRLGFLPIKAAAE